MTERMDIKEEVDPDDENCVLNLVNKNFDESDCDINSDLGVGNAMDVVVENFDTDHASSSALRSLVREQGLILLSYQQPH